MLIKIDVQKKSTENVMCFFFRLKAELEKKETENEELLSRMTSKHASELKEFQYQLMENETKRSEQALEIQKLQAKLTEQLNAKELQEQLTLAKGQIEIDESKIKSLIEENEKLTEESIAVSFSNVFLVCPMSIHPILGSLLVPSFFMFTTV